MTHPSPKVLVIWTRDLDSDVKNGRMLMLRALRDVVRGFPGYREVQYPSVFESKGTSRGLVSFVVAILTAGILNRPRPLQCALFAHTDEVMKRIGPIREEVVIFDSVRQTDLMRRLRALYPGKKFILDMDDLMSRRMDLLAQNGFRPSLGMFQERMPKLFAALLSFKALSGLVPRYEAMSLRRTEHEAVALSDKVIMVSFDEARMLHERTFAPADRIVSIAPPTHIPAKPRQFGTNDEPIRFCFVGSDRVVQNATTIDELLQIWRTNAPSSELVIYGQQNRSYDLPSNVRLGGFVDSFDDVYDGRTVLLAPTRMAGGVKTKFLEAFAHGAPVIGTDLTYEGVAKASPFLTLEQIGGVEALKDPEKIRPLLIEAAQHGLGLVQQEYSHAAHAQNWQRQIQQTAAA